MSDIHTAKANEDGILETKDASKGKGLMLRRLAANGGNDSMAQWPKAHATDAVTLGVYIALGTVFDLFLLGASGRDVPFALDMMAGWLIVGIVGLILGVARAPEKEGGAS